MASRCEICGMKECCGADLQDEVEALQARVRELEADLREYRNLAETLVEQNRSSIKLASDLLVAENRLAAQGEELRRYKAALEAVDTWDLNWADGLDSNVERIKTMVRDVLENKEK